MKGNQTQKQDARNELILIMKARVTLFHMIEFNETIKTSRWDLIGYLSKKGNCPIIIRVAAPMWITCCFWAPSAALEVLGVPESG